MAELKPILLVEDSPKDVELTLVALAKNHLANEVIVVRDGKRRWTTSSAADRSRTGRGATRPSCCWT